MKLTSKQKTFIDEYCIDQNGTQAYIRAGYKVSESVAKVSASRMLTNANIRKEVDIRLFKRATDNGVSADMVFKDLLELKDKCMGRKPVSFSHKNKDDEYEVIEKIIFDANGAKSTLELLGKHLKLFTERIESENVNTDITIKIDGEEFD